MPTCKRKRVLLTQPDDSLLSTQHDANKDVYLLAQTGEIFDSYEYVSCINRTLPAVVIAHEIHSRAYAARMSFYKLKQFQCEVTGKSGLDYFQALESEQQEARTLHTRFPEPLKAAVLTSVQWRMSSVLPSVTSLTSL